MEREKNLENCSEKSSVSELLLLETFKFLARSYLFLSALSSNPNPIFSIIISFYCLILLYLPHLFLSFVFSPVFISTAIILATLLRLGSTQQEKDEEISLTEIQNPDPKQEDPYWVQSETDLGLVQQEKDAIFPPENDPKDDVAKWVGAEKGTDTEMGSVRKPDFSVTFMEWNRSGRLEVIYEEYEGEEDEDSPENSPEMERRYVGIDGLLSSAFYYTDSESSEGEFAEEFPPAWDSPENLCFMWEEREGLIEIPLGLKSTVGFEVDEENLIEINLSVGGK